MVVLGSATEAAADHGGSAGFCTGVLIGPKRVLTSERCLRKRKAGSVVARVLDREGCRVRLRRRGRSATTVSVGAAAVVRLRRRVPASAAESLPIGEAPTAGAVVTAWGWGSGRPGDGCVPRPVRLRVTSGEECSDLVGEDGLSVYFCAVPEEERNTCGGDSGGPVVDEEGRLVGFTVAGRGCGTDDPARYGSTANLVARAG